MEKVRGYAKDVITSRLYWAPEIVPSMHQEISFTYASALEIGYSNVKAATYSVPHYSSYGLAFGPFSLDEVLRFCRGLSVCLRSQRKDPAALPLCLTTPPENAEAHSNASVLLGAYLVFCENWSAARVIEVLGRSDSERGFPCSWAKQKGNPNDWVMQVRHCWQGIEAAAKHGWIDLNCFCDDAFLEDTCERYRCVGLTYDSAWLVPGKILISSDPVTTMCDPNPQTFRDLWEEASTAPSTNSTPSTSDTEHNYERAISKPGKSVSKAYASKQAPSLYPLEDSDSFQETDSASFRSFLQECGVTLVIRNNFSDERGMPRVSYDEKR